MMRCSEVNFDGSFLAQLTSRSWDHLCRGLSVAEGRLQSGDYQEPGCSRHAVDYPAHCRAGEAGLRRLGSAAAAPTGLRVSGCRPSRCIADWGRS